MSSRSIADSALQETTRKEGGKRGVGFIRRDVYLQTPVSCGVIVVTVNGKDRQVNVEVFAFVVDSTEPTTSRNSE
jgi:hypothetical protein